MQQAGMDRCVRCNSGFDRAQGIGHMMSARRESVVFSDELTGRYLGPVTTD
jgi:7-keto-8-aminopelargonate synthetase-like enzyme